MPPERACRNVCRRNVCRRNVCRRNMLAETYAAETCLPEHTRRNMQTHSRPSTMFFLYNTNLSHGGAFGGCGLRKSGMRRAEYGFVLCGKYLSTLRKVLEYLPQGTLARSAFRRGASGKAAARRARKNPGKCPLCDMFWSGYPCFSHSKSCLIAKKSECGSIFNLTLFAFLPQPFYICPHDWR